MISEENLNLIYLKFEEYKCNSDKEAELREEDCTGKKEESDFKSYLYLFLSTLFFIVIFSIVLIVFRKNEIALILLQSYIIWYVFTRLSESKFNAKNRIFSSLSMSFTVIFSHLLNFFYRNFIIDKIEFNIDNIIKITISFFSILFTDINNTYIIIILILLGPIFGVFIFKNKTKNA